MAVDLTWKTLAEQEILWYHFRLGWDWHDFYETKEEADALLEALPEPVPLVFDLRYAMDLPPGMIMQAHKVATTRHPNGSPVVLFGASPVVRTTTNILKRMLGSAVQDFMGDVYFLDDEDELKALVIKCNKQST